jgi:hypothetical protein
VIHLISQQFPTREIARACGVFPAAKGEFEGKQIL